MRLVGLVLGMGGVCVGAVGALRVVMVGVLVGVCAADTGERDKLQLHKGEPQARPERASPSRTSERGVAGRWTRQSRATANLWHTHCGDE